MKRFLLTLLAFTIITPLFAGCTYRPISKAKEIDSIEIIQQSNNKIWSFSEKNEIDKIIQPLNDGEKTKAAIDIRPNDYLVNVYFLDMSSIEYRLWIDEDINVRGVLMDEETTWFLNTNSNPILKELLR